MDAEGLHLVRWRRLALVSSVLLAAFAAVHLIDDCLYDIPRGFNLPILATEALSLVFMASLVGLTQPVLA